MIKVVQLGKVRGAPQQRQASQGAVSESSQQAQPLGLGDMVEMVAHPIAVVLRLGCLDAQKRLRPESPCGRRKAWLNEQGQRIGIGKRAD